MKLYAKNSDECDASNAALARVALFLFVATLLYPFAIVLMTWFHEVATHKEWGRFGYAVLTLSLLFTALLSGASLILSFRAPKRRWLGALVAGLATLINLLAFVSAAISD